MEVSEILITLNHAGDLRESPLALQTIKMVTIDHVGMGCGYGR